MRSGAALCLALALAGCGGQQEQPGAPAQTAAAPGAQAAAGTPPVAYSQCRSCHAVEPGRNMIGPSLHDIVGKPAAAIPGYAYSKALKSSGLVWDEKTLDAWLENPTKLVPGNKMVFVGQRDPAKRKAIIDYLAAQK